MKKRRETNNPTLSKTSIIIISTILIVFSIYSVYVVSVNHRIKLIWHPPFREKCTHYGMLFDNKNGHKSFGISLFKAGDCRNYSGVRWDN